MQGLIDSAKLRIWDVVNELAKVKPTPDLRVALYSYGHASYGADNGYVRKEIDLTTDLDEVYAKLNALTIGGSVELVARVSRAALTDQKWADHPDALKLIFVCGNESVDQDKQFALTDVAALAKKAGVIVNAIHCAKPDTDEAKGWREFALMAGGSYASINQDQARRETAIATPFDKEMNELGVKLNGTYVRYGAKGERGAANQVAQDANAAKAAPGAAAERAASKAGALYKNSEWDLLDRMKEDPKFDLSQIKDEDLPEELKKLKPDERLPYLKKKGEERADLQKKITELSAKRGKFLDEEKKKQPKTDGEKALDEALKGMIREQAKAKGFELSAVVGTGNLITLTADLQLDALNLSCFVAFPIVAEKK
jgi:hypothetical protein